MSKKQTKADTQAPQSLCGYIHAVTPVTMSRRNFKYFNATFQTQRDVFHHTVIFAAEQHIMWSTTAKNGTAVKLTNTTNKPDPNSKSFSIHRDRNTVMEVIDVNFPHNPPIETQLMYVEDIKLLGPKQHVTKLQPTVVKVNPPTVNAWDTACEIKECFLRDKMGQIMLTLWDKLVTQVELNNTYEFENMQTRAFRGIPTLTSSRSTIIKPIQRDQSAGNCGEGKPTNSQCLGHSM
ncbi:uncharacterized protein LOC107690096 [Sinocyclocheilus anshuiensis]|uniref:uncharacterized protein LOC107690096 n=1 Tax=Sinocyclocheilus anshuiensis TaxID=1608454 RepID=UPI0007BA4920|nr:PREDICTED: uncharacterized protein LOC107690096 [Sinocyclocheilus anshuiensis]